MAVRFEYDAKQQLLLITFDGELLDEQLVSSYRLARQIGLRHEIKCGIIDGTGIVSFNISPDTVKSLAQHPTMFPERSRRCIVVPQDFLFGMARMYQALGGETRDLLRVVRNLEEAYKYLDITAPTNLTLVEE